MAGVVEPGNHRGIRGALHLRHRFCSLPQAFEARGIEVRRQAGRMARLGRDGRPAAAGGRAGGIGARVRADDSVFVRGWMEARNLAGRRGICEAGPPMLDRRCTPAVKRAARVISIADHAGDLSAGPSPAP
jgi:hypothetical protein